MINMNSVVGIDIGGSHITTALVDLEKKAILDHSLHRSRVNCHGSAREIIDSWCHEIENSFSKPGGPDPQSRKHWKIGIAMPGPFDYEKGVSLISGLDKYDALYGLNVRTLLSDALGMQPAHVLLKNDAACFLDGELFAGAGQGYQDVLGITLGTGFGTAFGINGVATDAQLWQTPFGDGLAEDHFSTKWFIKQAGLINGSVIQGVKDLIVNPAHAVIKEQLFSIFSAHLALFFKDLLTRRSAPDLIIVGGNIAQAKDCFWEGLHLGLKKHHLNLKFVISELGENAALLGAASLWKKTAVLT